MDHDSWYYLDGFWCMIGFSVLCKILKSKQVELSLDNAHSPALAAQNNKHQN